MAQSSVGELDIPIHPRDYPIFRPREDECPYVLLGLSESEPVDLDAIRVAKHQDNVVAAYRFKRLSALAFEIERLGVSESYRSRGIGGWMVAHAIGIIESKGGREVFIRAPSCDFLSRFGFEVTDSEFLRLTLTAE
ncbi:MAG: GNAT family N-acetyltransferase [Gammaproteobacteria bacterium]|nr:GNAT family N-acetyltransferase [Gammaproteobacteria bacterium]